MEWLFVAVYLAFGLFLGIAIGAGNRAGLPGAIICGVIGGVVLCVPFWSTLSWTNIAVWSVVTTIGSVWCTTWSESHPLKRFWRSPALGHLQIGPWGIGGPPGKK